MRVDEVEVAGGLKDRFLRSHHKDRSGAEAAWQALVRSEPLLRRDPFAGTQIPKDRFPPSFRSYANLWKLDLPHVFRAAYTVIGRPGGGVRVAVEWIGDHREYEKLFGYS